MFLSEKSVRNIILFCCCGITFYFTIDQFMKYFKNEDTSVLSYHKHVFDSESYHQYPTYTICFKKDWENIPSYSLKKLLKFTENVLIFDGGQYASEQKLPISQKAMLLSIFPKWNKRERI